MPGWGPADPKNRTGRYTDATLAPSVFTISDIKESGALYDYDITAVPPIELKANDNTFVSEAKDEQPMKSSLFGSNKVEPHSTSSSSSGGIDNAGFTHESTSF